MGEFDDLIPAVAPAKGAFDDLVPSFRSGTNDFEDLIPSADIVARAANALKAFPKALTLGVGDTISGGARAADIIGEGDLFNLAPGGTARPTLGQERRAFRRAMEDPRYGLRLIEAGNDPAAVSKVEKLYGPPAKLATARTPIEAGLELSAELSRKRQGRMDQSPAYQYGRAVSDVAQEIYPTRPDLDEKWESQLMAALGSTAPSVAAGFVPLVGPALSVAQYGLSQGEQGAQEALASGKPEAADLAYLANAGIGGATEAGLGAAPRLLRIVRAARLGNIAPGKFAEGVGTWARAHPKTAIALEVGLREGAQESLEQIGQNLIASDAAGYDPNRPWSKDVVRSGVLGGAAGLLIGGGAASFRRGTTTPPRVTTLELPNSEELQAAHAAVQSAAGAFEDLIPKAAETTPAALPVQTTGQESPPAPTPATAIEPAVAAAEAEAARQEANRQAVEQLRAKHEEERRVIEAARPARRVEPRADGIYDVLDAIQDLGGIAAPRQSQYASAGDYDGYSESFGQGAARLLRRVTGGLKPDDLRDNLGSMGFRFESTSEMYDAVKGAAQARQTASAGAPGAPGDAATQFYDAALLNKGKSATQRGAEWLLTGQLQPGDQFKIKGAGVTVHTVNPETGEVIVRAGRYGELDLPGGVKIYPDPGSYRKGSFRTGTGTGAAMELKEVPQWKNPPLTPMGPMTEGEGSGIPRALPQSAAPAMEAQSAGAARPGKGQRPGELPGSGAERAAGDEGRSAPLQGNGLTAGQTAALKEAMGRQYTAARAAEQHATARGLQSAWHKLRNFFEAETLYDIAKRWQIVTEHELRQEHARAHPALQQEFQSELAVYLAVQEQILANKKFARGIIESEELARAKAQFSEALEALFLPKMGIVMDPRRESEKVFNFYRALYNLAQLYIRKGVRSAEEFAKAVGVKLNTLVRQVWEDASAGQPKTSAGQLELATVLETVLEFRERQFSGRFDADERIDPKIREATDNRTYQQVGNALTVAEAMQIVEEQGIDAAINILKDEKNGMPFRTRVALGQHIIQKLNLDYQTSKAEGALDKTVEVAEWLTEFGTRLGQGVQAFAIWARLTPAGYVRAYRRAIEKSRTAGARRGTPEWKLPKYDEKIAKEVLEKSTSALEKPEGFQRDEKIIDVLSLIARQKGIRLTDVAIALWYANILSGWTTQFINIASTVMNVLTEAGLHLALNPRAMPDILAGLYQGMIRGAFDAVNVIRTGKITGTRIRKLEAPRVLEMINFPGLAKPLNAWKYVFRIMAAADMMNFRSAEEMKARWLARKIAREEGLSGNALGARMADILHNTKAMRQSAEAQARAEGVRGINFRRRVEEILEQHRPEQLVSKAAEFAKAATFNQEPEGVMGAIAFALNGLARDVPAVRLIVPFTHIVANVFNTMLNYTPAGYKQLFPSRWGGGTWGGAIAGRPSLEWGTDEFKLQAARATLGTIGMATLLALAEKYKHDEDPPFDLTAVGPANVDHRYQLQAMGWKPHSVKVGRTYYSYLGSPLAGGLAIVGNWIDAVRYKKLDEQDLGVRATHAIMGTMQALFSQSFLTGLSDFIDGLRKNYVDKNLTTLGGLSRTVSSVVIPNLVKQVDRIFDPTVYDGPEIEAKLIREIPVARGTLRPKINVLGEIVEYDVNRFFGRVKNDVLWETIVAKQAWISTPSKTMMIGDRPIGPEEYYDFVYTSGRAIRTHLEKDLPRMIMMSAEQAQEHVEDVVRAERRAAKRKLFNR